MDKNFWDRINLRWPADELMKWNSISKMAYLLFPIVIYYLIGDAVEILLWAVLNVIAKNLSENVLEVLSRNSYTINGIIFAIGAVCSVIIIRKAALCEIMYIPNGESKQNLSWKQIGILVAVGLAASIGLNYIFAATGLSAMSSNYDTVKESQYSVAFACGIFLYGILSPTVEEIIFRGILYNRMKRLFPIRMSMIVSALLFGLFHGNLVQGIYGFLMGLLIVFFYEKYQNFKAPLILHIVANVGVYVLTYTIWK